MLSYRLLRLLARGLSALPFSWLTALARFMTWISYDIFGIRKELMRKNLDIAFGDSKSDAEKTFIARQSVFHFAQTMLESFISEKYPMHTRIEIRHPERMQAAIDQGQGVYVLCFHMGNWEALASAVSKRFVPVHAVMKTIGSEGVNRYVEETRALAGLNWIKRSSQGDAYRGIVRVLKAGEIVGFIVDQARPGEPRLPFFSQDAKTNTSLAAIARKRPAPIVPCYIYRTAFAQHVATIGEPLTLALSNDPKADVLSNSTLFNQVTADIIRAHPEHYFWFHNRWK